MASAVEKQIEELDGRIRSRSDSLNDLAMLAAESDRGSDESRCSENSEKATATFMSELKSLFSEEVDELTAERARLRMARR